MNKEEVIAELGAFRGRLEREVVNAYKTRGGSFGGDRFNSWKRKLTQFLNEQMPGELATLDRKLTHVGYIAYRDENDAERFWRQYGEVMVSYLDSLILDVENGEFDFSIDSNNEQQPTLENNLKKDLSKVFIVHGHDGEAKERTARFVEKLGLNAIILHEQASRGATIVEKIEKYANVGFAIVLYTPDDLGNTKAQAEDGTLTPRARQNVIFEHGYLMGKIGRENVIPLVSGHVELPSDIGGMVYISDKQWQLNIAKEMRDAGYEIDFNKLI